MQAFYSRARKEPPSLNNNLWIKHVDLHSQARKEWFTSGLANRDALKLNDWLLRRQALGWCVVALVVLARVATTDCQYTHCHWPDKHDVESIDCTLSIASVEMTYLIFRLHWMEGHTFTYIFHTSAFARWSSSLDGLNTWAIRWKHWQNLCNQHQRIQMWLTQAEPSRPSEIPSSNSSSYPSQT